MKSKNTISKSDDREQYEYARTRIKKKKMLMRHFIFFLSGAILFLLMDLVLGFGKNSSLPTNWSSYLILFWFFILLVHTLNVFLLNRFMDKEWEDKQLEKLKTRQMERILTLQKKIEEEYPVSDRVLETNHLKEEEEISKSEETTNEDHSKYLP